MNVFSSISLWQIIVILVVIAIGIAAIKMLNKSEQREHAERKYDYRVKQFIMSKSEHDAFIALSRAVGDKYHIFPQIHISTFIDWKIDGQNWQGAMRHINQKSVDFLLCDKIYLNPKLAIELDDVSHERKDRIERDIEVERILASAHLPLLRITHSDLSVESLKKSISENSL